MGVSIMLGKKNITPGWRSMMYQLMIDNFGCIHTQNGAEFIFVDYNIPTLMHIAKKQYKGEKEKPFDYAEDIEKSFNKIIKTIQKKGEARVSCGF